jgi:succinate dehydrogenase/fumarate reductase flavoprotein subunit
VTKSAFYRWATFYHADGRPIEGAGSARGRSVIARTLMTEPVYCQLDQATEAMRPQLRAAQPNFFLPFDRAGIDPLTQRFPVTLRLEGTVRGTGGIRIADEGCGTSVPGLYAAGDAATRELICGGFTGGGSHNAAWAISSGFWAGQSAARHTKSLGHGASKRSPRAAGRATLEATTGKLLDPEALVRDVQAEVFPYERNLFRTERGLVDSLGRLDGLWTDIQVARPEQLARSVIRGREAAAMLATARWMYTTARHRQETRGMHKHQDFPELDPTQQRRLVTSGLDAISVRPERRVEA